MFTNVWLWSACRKECYSVGTYLDKDEPEIGPKGKPRQETTVSDPQRWKGCGWVRLEWERRVTADREGFP